MQLSDASHFDAEWSQLEQLLASKPAVVRIEGRAGSGRRALMQRLEKGGFAVVDVPPVRDPDAAIAALLELAAKADGALELAQQDERSFNDRMRGVVAQLAKDHRGIAFRLNDDFPTESHELDKQVSLPLLRELLMGWPTGAFPLIGLGTRQALDELAIDRARVHELKTPLVQLPDFDVARFGPLASVAEAAVQRLCRAKRVVNPLELRWWVGLVALEEQAGTAPTSPPSTMQALASQFASRLLAVDHLQPSVLRLALARRGIPRRQVATFAPPDDEVASALLLDCAAYGSDSLLMHEQLRRNLLYWGRAIPRSTRQDAHRDLARTHKLLDGTNAIAASQSPRDWLERAHHLPHSGLEGLKEWETLEFHCRQFYWDCGRGLSLAKCYDQAAKVFSDCIARFDPKGQSDSYAQHYLGFNLDRAGCASERAEAALRRAVQLDPTNVWWNGRLVTFLIDQARFLDARREWLAALSNVDPDEYEVSKDGWLALHLHRWTALAWLDVGEVELAREVVDGIPPDIIEANEQLRKVEQRLLDAEEARQLGESVYPEDIPSDRRWTDEPLWVPSQLPDGSSLQHWYPGRIVQADDASVVVVFATRSPDQALRRTKVREFGFDDWVEAAGRTPKESSGFIEIGVYDTAGERLHIEVRPSLSMRFVDVAHETRYLRQWVKKS